MIKISRFSMPPAEALNFIHHFRSRIGNRHFQASDMISYNETKGRKTGLSLLTALALAVSMYCSPAFATDTIEVVLDQAKILQLPPNTATIIVGNPIIADITMLRRTNQMVLTGKGYGQTNMIALDSEGNAIGESIVKVFGIEHGLIVQRGMNRETYSCNPRCQPTINLGDDPAFMGRVAGEIKVRSGAAGGK